MPGAQLKGTWPTTACVSATRPNQSISGLVRSDRVESSGQRRRAFRSRWIVSPRCTTFVNAGPVELLAVVVDDELLVVIRESIDGRGTADAVFFFSAFACVIPIVCSADRLRDCFWDSTRSCSVI